MAINLRLLWFGHCLCEIEKVKHIIIMYKYYYIYMNCYTQPKIQAYYQVGAKAKPKALLLALFHTAFSSTGARGCHYL